MSGEVSWFFIFLEVFLFVSLVWFRTLNFTLLDKAFLYFLNNIKLWDINNLLKSSLMF